MDFIKEMKAANAHHADIQKKLPALLSANQEGL
jgi:hypothetical protein